MSMFPIASSTIASNGTASVDFQNIPQTFTHLQIRMFVRQFVAGTEVSSWVYLNNDTSTSNYANHRFYGTGSAVTSEGWAAGSFAAFVSGQPGGGQASDIFGFTISDFLNYSSTTQNKTIRHVSGFDSNGGGWVYLQSNLWLNTAAINRITITPQQQFAAGSRVDLYGISTSNLTGA